MTRDQLAAANELAGAVSPEITEGSSSRIDSSAKPASTIRDSSGLTSSRPAIPGDIPEYFFPNNLGINEAAINAGLASNVGSEGIVYRPGIMAQAEIRYLSRQHDLEHSSKISALLEDPGSGLIHWEDMLTSEFDSQHLDSQPLPKALFHPVPS